MDKKGLNRWVVFFGLLISMLFVYYLFKKLVFKFLVNILPLNDTNTLEKVFIFLVVLILTYFFVSFSSRLLKGYLVRKNEKRDVKLLISVYRYFIWTLVIFITFSLLFEQIGSLITSVGLIGFGITLALQKPILNFVGWLTIVFGKAYKIGDIIHLSNVNGQVYDITVMYTNLSEMNNEGEHTGKSISLPNEFILTTPITNYTKGTSFIWDELNIYLTFHSNWEKTLKISNKTLNEVVKDYFRSSQKIPKSANTEKPIVRMYLTEKGINIKLRYFIDFHVANQFKTELSGKLLNELRKNKDIILGKTESVV
ncbi:MAG: mechanosensitive ion channel family protein [Nanoarchaeota archaeon]|mgnify:CR=1 FL=1